MNQMISLKIYFNQKSKHQIKIKNNKKIGN